jgi:hypothetical protein
LIEHLRWHGPLSCDLVLGAAGPVIIDINPRLVEPMNAWFAGVDILGTILTLARGEHPPPQPESRPGVRSRQLLVGILGAAEHFRTRRAVLAELNTALSCTGDYRGAAEELTPWKGDPLALVPVGAATIATLLWPSSWRWFAEGAVRHYALTPSVWRELITRAATGGH